MATNIEQFSEFEVKESTVAFWDNATENSGTAMALGCVGSLEETLNTRTITKKCEGVLKKSVTRSDGSGEIKFTLHMRWEVFKEMFGLISEGLKTGVYAYGTGSRHKEFCYTAKVLDEDGNVKYKAYPKCCVTTGLASKIENGAEEVAEIEVTASVFADASGNCMYQAFEDDLDETTSSKWLSTFTADLVKGTA